MPYALIKQSHEKFNCSDYNKLTRYRKYLQGIFFGYGN